MPADHSQHNELPEKLVATLKDEQQGPPLITARVDREIAALSATHFAGRRDTGRRKAPAWFAAAAAVLIAVLLVPVYRSSVDEPAVLLTDVDQSGQVDIADVLALARDNKQLQQEDLDRFALQVVALNSQGDAS